MVLLQFCLWQKGSNKMKVYGYCRISTSKQSMERQIRNIKLAYPDAVIVKETYTGTKMQGRKEFEKLLKIVSTGDTLVFDSVSRMSRTAQEGYGMYEELYKHGVSLVFLKEPHINTSTYQQAMENQLSVNFKQAIKHRKNYWLVYSVHLTVICSILQGDRSSSLLNRQRKRLQICTKEHVKKSKPQGSMVNRSGSFQERSLLLRNL